MGPYIFDLAYLTRNMWFIPQNNQSRIIEGWRAHSGLKQVTRKQMYSYIVLCEHGRRQGNLFYLTMAHASMIFNVQLT